MGLEIDFLPVGDGEKCGDAIALRWGDLHGGREAQTVVVVDGGFADDGEALASHLLNYYGTTRADIVIATHPDQDHVNGLKALLGSIDVGLLCMHLPWTRSDAVKLAKSAGFASSGMLEKFAKNFASAAELEDFARSNGIPIVEPFAGQSTPDGVLTILSPTEVYYHELLAEIAGGAEPSAFEALLSKLTGHVGEAAQKLVPESLFVETLTDWGQTTPQNNSSVICLVRVDGQAALLTADAGMPALSMAADQLDAMSLVPGGLTFVQVPHHGSRRNVGPTVLDRLLGTKGQSQTRGTAFVSASQASPKHPAKKVTNAFLRRGYPVHGGDDGLARWHHHNAPARNWNSSTPHALYQLVEDDEG